MLDFISYDFGYSSSIRFAMFVPLILAGSIAAAAAWRSWPRWVLVPAAVVALWSLLALLALNAMLNSPMRLPTARFLTSGAGRVLDGRTWDELPERRTLHARLSARDLVGDVCPRQASWRTAAR